MRIPVEHIDVDMKATERFDAICDLVDRMVTAGSIPLPDRALILEKLWSREQLMSTGIGFGLAIPHAIIKSLPESQIAIGRSRTGIPFQSLDNSPVFLILLFLVPGNEHLQTLKEIAKRLSSLYKRGLLWANLTAQEIADLLNNSPEDDQE